MPCAAAMRRQFAQIANNMKGCPKAFGECKTAFAKSKFMKGMKEAGFRDRVMKFFQYGSKTMPYLAEVTGADPKFTAGMVKLSKGVSLARKITGIPNAIASLPRTLGNMQTAVTLVANLGNKKPIFFDKETTRVVAQEEGETKEDFEKFLKTVEKEKGKRLVSVATTFGEKLAALISTILKCIGGIGYFVAFAISRPFVVAGEFFGPFKNRHIKILSHEVFGYAMLTTHAATFTSEVIDLGRLYHDYSKSKKGEAHKEQLVRDTITGVGSLVEQGAELVLDSLSHPSCNAINKAHPALAPAMGVVVAVSSLFVGWRRL